MSMIRLGATGALVCALAMPAVAFVEKTSNSRQALGFQRAGVSVRVERLALDDPSPAGRAAYGFTARYGGEWVFTVDRRTARFPLVQGSGVALIPGRGNDLGPGSQPGLRNRDGRMTPETLEPRVRAFIEDNRALVVPDRGALVLDPDSSMIRENGRLISMHYDWVVDGIPVEGARVFVRLNSGNVTQIGAPLVGPIALDTLPAIDADAATERLLAYSGDAEMARLRGEPELVIQPEDGAAGELGYRLVWKITYRMRGKIETWQGRVDAHTGLVVGFEDTNKYHRVVGGVYPRTVFENNETTVPMVLADVATESGALTADVSGAYTYSGGTVFAGLNGSLFNTHCEGCSNPAQPAVQRDTGSGRLDFGAGGDDEIGNGLSTPAGRNVYFHLHQVRRLGKKWLPSFSYLDAQDFGANVNINSSCNAVYSGFEVNFFRAGGNCNNTGEVADIVYHEYGHGIDSQSNSGDGATGEGTADVVSIHMTRSPLIGPGFRVTGSPVRNIDQNTTSKGLLTVDNVDSKCGPGNSNGPLGNEVHCEGEIWGQTAWDLSQALVAKYGQHTGWRESERMFFNSLADAGSYLADGTEPIYTAYVNADDDDGNLANGTPNGQEIFDAFDAHGIANAAVGSSPTCTRPSQPVLAVTPLCDRFDLSWTTVAGATEYQVLRAELIEDMANFPVASVTAPQTTFTDTAVMPDVDYWYVVSAVDATGCESTVENLVAANLPSQPILDVTLAVEDDEPRGNRSGFADPGEEVDLQVTLANVGAVGATLSSGTITTATPGATLLLDSSDWSDLTPGGAAVNLDPLRFESDDLQLSCGDEVSFQFVPDDASGCASPTSFFSVTLGQRLIEVEDNFESDLGWQPDTVNSTATTGQWVRANPEATSHQPGDCVTPGGSLCWFTGSNPGGGAGTDDVDDGVVILESPTFDLSGLVRAEVSYYRWFSLGSPGADAGDFFTVEVSDDDGLNWVELETLGTNAPVPAWIESSFKLESLISLTDQVRFRFQAADGATTGGIVEAAIDDFRINRFVCDSTPACFDAPTFGGVGSVAAGPSCGEIDLSWSAAASNCTNATITYNVYRDTAPGFAPGPANLIASGLPGLALTDVLLDPDQDYSYIVRAFDSRSGEEGNTVELSATPPESPDLSAPIFSGLDSVVSGDVCAETLLFWSTGLESCNLPVAYDIYRSTDPGFTPDPSNRLGTTFSTSFIDAGGLAGAVFTYVVRARDALGNTDTNTLRITEQFGVLDLTVFETPFELDDAGWTVEAPNDATAGNWAWGDPAPTSYQSGDDATPLGVNAWITGLSTGPGNDDVDGGTTTLVSSTYDLSTAVDPALRYARWFNNHLGGSANDATDAFKAEVSSDDGSNWVELDSHACPDSIACPFEWVDVQHTIPLPYTDQMRFRFTAADLGSGSLVEAGVDEFELTDLEQGCSGCAMREAGCALTVEKNGGDIVLSWTAEAGTRVTIFKVSSCGDRIKLGSSDTGSFVHENAALSTEAFNYRTRGLNECGQAAPFGLCLGVNISCP